MFSSASAIPYIIPASLSLVYRNRPKPFALLGHVLVHIGTFRAIEAKTNRDRFTIIPSYFRMARSPKEAECSDHRAAKCSVGPPQAVTRCQPPSPPKATSYSLVPK